MGERSGAPRPSALYQSSFSKPPVAVQLPQPDVSANRDAPQSVPALACRRWAICQRQPLRDLMDNFAGPEPFGALIIRIPNLVARIWSQAGTVMTRRRRYHDVLGPMSRQLRIKYSDQPMVIGVI